MNTLRYRNLLDTMNLGVQENDCSGTITYSNRAHHNILGFSDGELIGKKIWDLQQGDEGKERLKQYFQTIIATEPSPEPFLTKNLRKNGTIIDVQVDWNYDRDNQNKLQGFVSVISDISERKSIEKKLIDLNGEYASLIRTCQNLAENLDLQQVLQISVDSVTELVGLDTAAIYLLENNMLRLSATTPPLPANFPDEMRYAPLIDHPHILKAIRSREPVLISDYLENDLSPAEFIIAQSRNLRTLFFIPLLLDRLAMGVFIVGSIGKPVHLPEVKIRLSQTLASLSSLSLKNAKLYEESLANAAMQKQMLTERIQIMEEKSFLEQQLIQAQKMDAIGRLAGGIAHDFNNILTALFGFTQIAQLNVDNPEKLIKALNGANLATKRAQNLVRQILTFSRNESPAKENLKIDDVIVEAVQLVRQAIPANIEIRCEGRTQQEIFADPTQIHQIVINLCTNAYQAIGGKNGTLTVRFYDEQLLEAEAANNSSRPSGDYVVLSISDDGIGMSAEVIQKIFNPFFTTKEIGKGTGFGLSVVDRIVSEHQGFIVVNSAPGVGSTINVSFPVSKSVAVSSYHLDELQVDSGLQGDERILFVDDEQSILSIAELAFANFGYEISVYNDPCEALEHFAADVSRYQILVTDMTMPRMTGIELSKKAHSLSPDLKIFLCSGFSDLIDSESAQKNGVTDLVNKPYQFKDLLRRIRQSFAEENC